MPPANQTVNVGSDVTLHCVATTDELERHKLKISWLLNGEKIEFGSRTNVAQYDPDKSLKITQAQIDNTGSYTCNASTELDWDAVTVKLTVRGMTFITSHYYGRVFEFWPESKRCRVRIPVGGGQYDSDGNCKYL